MKKLKLIYATLVFGIPFLGVAQVVGTPYIQPSTAAPAVTAFCGQLATGTGDGTTLANAAPSCRTIKEITPSAADGLYFIDVDGPAGVELPFKGYCDMTTDGGGWLLISKSAVTGFGPSKIEMTGDVTLSGTNDPWSNTVITMTNTNLEKFTAPTSANGYLPLGFAGSDLQSVVSPPSATGEEYSILSRNLIEIYRGNGCYLDAAGGVVSLARNMSVLRFSSSNHSLVRYFQSPKRFNPITPKCAAASGTCSTDVQTGCAADMIVGMYTSYNALTNTAAGFSSNYWAWYEGCAAPQANGSDSRLLIPAGFMGGYSNGNGDNAICFYDLSLSQATDGSDGETSSGPIYYMNSVIFGWSFNHLWTAIPTTVSGVAQGGHRLLWVK